MDEVRLFGTIFSAEERNSVLGVKRKGEDPNLWGLGLLMF